MAVPEHVSLYRRGRIWWAVFHREGKRVFQSTGTDNIRVAEETRRSIERELYDGTEGLEHTVVRALRDPRRRDAILAALAVPPEIEAVKALDEYLRHSATYKEEETIYNDRLRLQEFISNSGVRCIADVTTTHVADFLALKKTRDHVMNTTVLRHREALHAWFEWAVDMGHCATNPVSKTKRPPLPELDPRFLSLKEIDACLKGVEGNIVEPVIASAIFAGLRRKELCWLTTNDVDLDKRLLHVRTKVVEGTEWRSKTKRNRKIPISTSLYPYVARQRLKCGDGPWFFLSPEGCRWDPDNLGHRLHQVMAETGADWTFLTFRHTFGSHLAQRGVSLYKIATLMGNSPQIVQRHYARLIPENLRDEVEFQNIRAKSEMIDAPAPNAL